MDIFDKNRSRVLIISVTIVIFAVVIGAYLVLRESGERPFVEKKISPVSLPRMANLPPKEITEPRPPEPSYPPDAPVLEQARQALRDGIEAKEAVVLAKSFPDRPESPDAAFLLLEYAAEQGNAEAALAVGQFYDPSYGGPSGTIQKNPLTAYEWYGEAWVYGEEKAKERLAELRQWLENQSSQGSTEARDVLSQWR